MVGFLQSMLELFGVVFLRFRPIPRLWCVWLVGVNAACLYFITHIEAQVVLVVTAIDLSTHRIHTYPRINPRLVGSHVRVDGDAHRLHHERTGVGLLARAAVRHEHGFARSGHNRRRSLPTGRAGAPLPLVTCPLARVRPKRWQQ